MYSHKFLEYTERHRPRLFAHNWTQSKTPQVVSFKVFLLTSPWQLSHFELWLSTDFKTIKRTPYINIYIIISGKNKSTFIILHKRLFSILQKISFKVDLLILRLCEYERLHGKTDLRFQMLLRWLTS